MIKCNRGHVKIRGQKAHTEADFDVICVAFADMYESTGFSKADARDKVTKMLATAFLAHDEIENARKDKAKEETTDAE